MPGQVVGGEGDQVLAFNFFETNFSSRVQTAPSYVCIGLNPRDVVLFIIHRRCSV